MSTTHDWGDILRKYRKKTLTDEERAYLEQRVKESPLAARAVEEMDNPLLLLERLYELRDLDVEAGWRKLEAAILDKNRPNTNQPNTI